MTRAGSLADTASRVPSTSWLEEGGKEKTHWLHVIMKGPTRRESPLWHTASGYSMTEWDHVTSQSQKGTSHLYQASPTNSKATRNWERRHGSHWATQALPEAGNRTLPFVWVTWKGKGWGDRYAPPVCKIPGTEARACACQAGTLEVSCMPALSSLLQHR